jgi:hypothetical protein
MICIEISSRTWVASIDPRAGDTVTMSDGTVLTWKRYKPWRQYVVLIDGVGNYRSANGYAFCVIQSEIAGSAKAILAGEIS